MPSVVHTLIRANAKSVGHRDNIARIQPGMTMEKEPDSQLAEIDSSNRHVNMSNKLARAAHSLNLSEKRLVAMGLAGTDSKPQKNLVLALNAGWKMRVAAVDYAESFGIDQSTAYTQLKGACEKLFERYVTYTTKGPRGKPIDKRFRWVSSATYAEGEGYVELNFTPEIAPHLLGLSRQFTSYRLRHAAAFDSVYAWRLYELLRSWQSTGVYTTNIEDFWDVMEANPSCRKDFKELRTRVIEPSVKSIVAKAGMLVEWTPIRKGGRRVSSLEFRMSHDPQGRLDIDGED